jgi:hypothetical protein
VPERGLYDAFIDYVDTVLRSLAEIPEDWHDRNWLRTALLPRIARHIAGAPDDGTRAALLDRHRRLQERLAALAASPPPLRN